MTEERFKLPPEPLIFMVLCVLTIRAALWVRDIADPTAVYVGVVNKSKFPMDSGRLRLDGGTSVYWLFDKLGPGRRTTQRIQPDFQTGTYVEFRVAGRTYESPPTGEVSESPLRVEVVFWGDSISTKFRYQ